MCKVQDAHSTAKPADPPNVRAAHLSSRLVGLLAVASAVSVANVYYAQPLLDALATDFGISQAAVGGVVTATQAGSACALLLLVPLGDRMDRRRLLLAQAGALVLALVGVGFAPSPVTLLAAMLAIGLLGTAMTQGLIAYAASAAAPGERGRVVGTAQAGVVIGLLMARVVAGGIADLAGWRAVYGCSALAMAILGMGLWWRLPAQPRPVITLSYSQLIVSLLALVVHDRVLQVRGLIAMLMFGALSIFWSALVLPLGAAPFGFSHTAIGAFGLVGVAGALAAARAGRWADAGHGQRTTGWALLLLSASWIALAALDTSLAWLIVGIVALDLAGQAIHVTNQSMIFSAHPQAQSRVVGAYMLFYSVGSGLGALASTHAFAAGGWAGVCWLGAGVSVAALAFWALTLRAAQLDG